MVTAYGEFFKQLLCWGIVVAINHYEWVDIPKVSGKGQMVELLRVVKYCWLTRQSRIRKQILD
jgi:hypothetical protein